MKKFDKIIVIIIIIGMLIIFLSTLIPIPDSYLDLNRIASTKIYDRHGVLLREVLSSESSTARKIDIQQIPEFIKEVFIITEDKRFYQHPGVDIFAITRAVIDNLKHKKIKSGASTITQQLVRNIYKLPRNLPNKLYEAWLALRLEHTLTKDQILEQYLNRIPFGNQTYGIGAATELYFSKPVADLTIAEAAFLAAIPQSPTGYNPYRHYDKALMRQKKILNLMLKNGRLQDEDYQRIRKQKIVLADRETNFKAPHFCHQVISRFKDNYAMPSKVYTTLNYYLQKNIQSYLNGRLKELASYNVHNASVLVMDNTNGEILVWIGSHNFFDDQNAGQVDGVVSLRQPGSTLKPFTYGLAMQQGMTAATVIPDIKTHADEVSGFYTPQNYDNKFHGPVTIRRALACSYNVPPVRILERIGEAALLQLLHQAGFNSLNKPAVYYGKGLTLGNGEVTLLELVRAYAALANGGKLLREKLILHPNNKGQQFSNVIGTVFNKNINAILIDILCDNEARIPAFGKFSPLYFPFDCAAKTGTSKDYRDNWAIGCTPEVTAGVWVGNFNGEPMHNVSGISGAGPLLNDIMYFLDKYFNFSSFKKPDDLETVKICPISGKLAGLFCSGARLEFFLPGTTPIDSCDWHRLIEIDIRNGKIATKSTSVKFVADQIFLDLPPIYLPWMIENNISLIPKDSTDSIDNEKRIVKQLRITSPIDGEIYKIDPILRGKYQQIQLTAEVPKHIDQIQWMINEERYKTVNWPFQLTWQLEPGKYRFQVFAEAMKSDVTEIMVLP